MNDELESDDLRRLLDAAAKLPREVAPPAGAWTAIRSRIEAQRVQAIAPATGAVTARRIEGSWRLAAAAVILLAVLVPVISRLQNPTEAEMDAYMKTQRLILDEPPGRDSIRTPAALAPVRAVTTVPNTRAVSNPALAASLEQYQQATRELEAAVTVQTAGLAPATREVVKRSLATIDGAITELRAALGSDPRNAALGQYLSAAYEQKLDFLKRVRTLPGAGM